MSDIDVITGEAPNRYASALLDLAEEGKSLARVEKDLKSFRKALDSSADLQRLLDSPVFETKEKINALTAIAKKLKLSALTTQFIGTVAGNDRARDLPVIMSAFTVLLAKRRGTQVAKVTSAQKLTAAQLTSIKSQLKKTLGQTVDIEANVDPSLIGGFKLRVGSRLFDSSLKTKLEDLRLALKET